MLQLRFYNLTRIFLLYSQKNVLTRVQNTKLIITSSHSNFFSVEPNNLSYIMCECRWFDPQQLWTWYRVSTLSELRREIQIPIASTSITMTLTLWHHPLSPPSRAVIVTAKLLKIPLREQLVDLAKGEHLASEFVKVTLFVESLLIDNLISMTDEPRSHDPGVAGQGQGPGSLRKSRHLGLPLWQSVQFEFVPSRPAETSQGRSVPVLRHQHHLRCW